MFEYFVENGYISSNPVKVKLLKENESQKIYFEDKDLKLLFDGIKEKEIKDFITVSLYSGMRLSEIVYMKKEDIYDGLFHIRDGKTKNSKRVIHIHSKIKDIVDYYIKNNEGEFLIFDGRKDPIQKRVNRRIQPIIQDPNKTFHSCRKNFIRELLKIEQKELHYIQMIVGHQISEGTKLTTQTYGNEIQVPSHIMRNYVESVSYNLE
jgi:integrase